MKKGKSSLLQVPPSPHGIALALSYLKLIDIQTTTNNILA